MYMYIHVLANSGDSGVMVNLLACRARGLGFELRSRHKDFLIYLLLLSPNMTELLLRDVKSSKPKFLANLSMYILYIAS